MTERELMKCARCGEGAMTIRLINPDTRRSEYFARVIRTSKCKMRRSKSCQTGLFLSEQMAIEEWNEEFGRLT